MTRFELGGDGRASEWEAAHEALSSLSRRRAECDWLEGKGLLRAVRAKVHEHFGFASFGEYVERLFGYGPRTTDEKLRVAKALEDLPQLERAFSDGALCRVAAMRLSWTCTIFVRVRRAAAMSSTI